MQWVAAFFVSAQTCHQQGSHITPGALVDGLMDIDVFRLLFAVKGSVGRKTDALGCSARGSVDLPAFVRKGDVDLLPDLGVLDAVIGLQVVHIKSTDVTEDLLGALIAPMLR